MPYWRLFYHVVWSTKGRLPLLTPEVEPLIFGYIRSKARSLECTILALNNTVDHVHLVASIPPKLAIATLVGQVKGASSAQFNKEYPGHTPFVWQESYGVLSFDAKRLPPVIAYVEHQKEHHRLGTTIAALERDIEDAAQDTTKGIAEDTATYHSLSELADELAELE